MPERDPRKDFLIAMYNQLMNDINRHIIVVWQSIATLGVAITAFTLVKDHVISVEIAVSIVLIICIWVIAHVYDASYWYNRNLVMIANIERQFLLASDLRDIHYYFGKHRPAGKMISHLKIQMWLALGIAGFVLAYEFLEVLLPMFCGTDKIRFVAFLPWVIAMIGIGVWVHFHRDTRQKYAEFVQNSPGITVDTTGISYGKGHGFRK